MILTGAAGGGKSLTAGNKINAFMKKYDGAAGLMLRKAREWCKSSIVPAFDKQVIGNDRTVQKVKSDFRYNYPTNGSVLFWGGMKDDAQRESIRSIGPDGALDIVWVEEANAFIRDDLDELLPRMRGKAASWTQIILTTNSDHPFHWIKQLMDSGNPDIAVFYSDWSQNPYNPPEYEDKLNMLTGLKRARLRDGLWVQAEGVVYPEFDQSVHVIDPIDIPDDWARFRVIDFGFVNPFVCQWWAVDKENRMYMYREIYMTGRTVTEHAEGVKVDDIIQQGVGYINKYPEAIEQTICDHDATDRAALRAAGIYSIPAKKDISSGLDLVRESLHLNNIFFFKGALVEVDETLVNKPIMTTQEFSSYVWPKGVDGKSLKEVPVDLDNHGMDTTRYGAKYREGRRSLLLF